MLDMKIQDVKNDGPGIGREIVGHDNARRQIGNCIMRQPHATLQQLLTTAPSSVTNITQATRQCHST